MICSHKLHKFVYFFRKVWYNNISYCEKLIKNIFAKKVRNKVEENIHMNEDFGEGYITTNYVKKLHNRNDFFEVADKIIKDAEATAKDIIAKAKAEAEKLGKTFVKEDVKVETKVEPKVEPVKEPEVKVEPVKEESASSRFFKKAAEEAPAKKPFADEDDDDEIFVGEIEDARKPERMMIGDGEEEEEMDFEFL